MKKAIAIALITIALFGISQIPVTTTYEDGSTYQESLGSQLIYTYIEVPLARIQYHLSKCF